MTVADVDRVIEIASSLKDAPEWPRAAYLAALEGDGAPRRIALVGEDAGSGAVAGFAVASLLAHDAELESIAVAAEVQRRGLARRLLAVLVDELRAAEVAEVNLEARASNQPALALYLQLGFVESGRRTRYYQFPVDDAILMRLRL
jgi:ribosomal-protein-alanine acetyltransferase